MPNENPPSATFGGEPKDKVPFSPAIFGLLLLLLPNVTFVPPTSPPELFTDFNDTFVSIADVLLLLLPNVNFVPPTSPPVPKPLDLLVSVGILSALGFGASHDTHLLASLLLLIMQTGHFHEPGFGAKLAKIPPLPLLFFSLTFSSSEELLLFFSVPYCLTMSSCILSNSSVASSISGGSLQSKSPNDSSPNTSVILFVTTFTPVSVKLFESNSNFEIDLKILIISSHKAIAELL